MVDIPKVLIAQSSGCFQLTLGATRIICWGVNLGTFRIRRIPRLFFGGQHYFPPQLRAKRDRIILLLTPRVGSSNIHRGRENNPSPGQHHGFILCLYPFSGRACARIFFVLGYRCIRILFVLGDHIFVIGEFVL